RVAVKALSPELAQADGFRERFQAEIDSLRLLRHEGIVELYGYGQQDDTLFYAMEVVDGSSLEDELHAGRRFNWREVTQIAIQVCRALKHAHDHGVIHRDIKPANIMLDRQERAKLADFGIARLFGATQLTAAGGVLGTADYMAPEQADGRPVSARCDQYSLGCVLYALLAGRPPFRAKTLPEMLQLQRYAEPEPLRRFAPQTPADLERAIAQMLAKAPEERFPNTLVLARHLEAMLLALSKPSREQPDPADSPPVGEPLDSLPIDMRATQAERGPSTGPPPSVPIELAPHEPTLAGATAAAGGHVAGGRPIAKEPAAIEPDSVTPDAPTGLTSNATPSFTLVGQEPTAEASPPRWVAAAQLASAVLVLGGLAYGASFVLSGPDADTLHGRIQQVDPSRWAAGDQAARRLLAEFDKRFPQDPRSTNFAPHREQLATHELARRLRAARLRGGEAVRKLSAAEQLYVAAVDRADVDPLAAEGQLAGLITLLTADQSAGAATHPAAEDTGAALHGRLVTLAKRQIERLQTDRAAAATTQLPLLRDRLAVAKQAMQTDPERAAA
ncbi:MAG: serine/threonine-protein kinase, partial [Planctomycetota bacterium]